MTAIIAIVGDLHCNSTVALCPPSIALDDGGTYQASREQRWIWRQWRTYWEAVCEKRQQAGGRLIVILNGELGDNNYHPTTQLVTRNPADMMRLSVEVLKPMLELEPDAIFVTRGTEAHTGVSSHLDELIARDIGATPCNDKNASYQNIRAEADGVRFDVAHHPPGGVGRVPWAGNNYAGKLAAMASFNAAERDERPPHLLIRGHVHRPGDSYDAYRTRAIVHPAWQLMGSYGYRIGGEPLPVGGLIVTCDRGRYEVEKLYSSWPTGGFTKI